MKNFVMASHYRFYPASEDVIIPWNATYEFPSLANKAVKITPRLPPKNGATFLPGNQIRLEFPAQGYVHGAHTTLEFDVTIQGYNEITSNTDRTNWTVWFQNNIGSIFSRIRLLYGSTELEEIQEAGFLIRQLTQFTQSANSVFDQCSFEGVGGTLENTFPDPNGFRNNVRRISHCLSLMGVRTGASDKLVGYPNLNRVSPPTATARYQIQLPLGLFTQGKLIPVKFMASQLAIELTLAQPASCMMANPNSAWKSAQSRDLPTGTPTYSISNVNLIPEILEFDSLYDEHFLQGLQTGGMPLQFSTWNTFVQPVTGQYMQVAIQERSRSVKAIFGFIRKSQTSLLLDHGASFGDIETAILESYQYRIGGRYFPAAPVQVAAVQGYKGSGVEAWTELEKALHIIGDSRLSVGVNSLTWNGGIYPLPAIWQGDRNTEGCPSYGADDFQVVVHERDDAGIPNLAASKLTGYGDLTSSVKGSSVFCMAINLETTSGREISGLNAEEQSDITLMIKWQTAPPAGYELVVYTLCDRLMVLRENNVIELTK
jgi:hypothetical protein